MHYFVLLLNLQLNLLNVAHHKTIFGNVMFLLQRISSLSFFASYIMEEYQDCLKRARRLAVACEATLAGSDSAMSVVTMEDLLIYTRWLICMLHSVKAIHALIRVSIKLCLKFGRLGQTHVFIVEQQQIM